MLTSIFIIGSDELLIWTRLLITSNGKIATHKQIPPTPPQTIVLTAPKRQAGVYSFLMDQVVGLNKESEPISSLDFPGGVRK